MNFIPSERATPIRMPSTANLMLDSADRTSFFPSAWDFQITKSNSIMNGFFTRIGATEVVLEWCEPNMADEELIVDVSGATVRSTATVTILNTFMTVADCLNECASQLNNTNGVTFSVFSSLSGYAGLDASGGKFRVYSSSLQRKLGFDLSGALTSQKLISPCADLRLYRYIDFVSPQLTYNQDLKDNSTAPLVRDVLSRWYFDEDVPEQRDSLGYPILMGYEAFRRRRLFNPPKQIKWDSKQPLGNMAFQVFDNNGNLLPQSQDSNWLMTLQMSEV